MVRLLAALSLIVALAGCGGADNIWASDQTVADAVYRHDGPPTLTLFTVISKASGSGAHSALMVNGSQRLIFDPAGTFHHPNLPERHDVIYGMTDPAVDFPLPLLSIPDFFILYNFMKIFYLEFY